MPRDDDATSEYAFIVILYYYNNACVKTMPADQSDLIRSRDYHESNAVADLGLFMGGGLINHII